MVERGVLEDRVLDNDVLDGVDSDVLDGVDDDVLYGVFDGVDNDFFDSVDDDVFDGVDDDFLDGVEGFSVFNNGLNGVDNDFNGVFNLPGVGLRRVSVGIVGLEGVMTDLLLVLLATPESLSCVVEVRSLITAIDLLLRIERGVKLPLMPLLPPSPTPPLPSSCRLSLKFTFTPLLLGVRKPPPKDLRDDLTGVPKATAS